MSTQAATVASDPIMSAGSGDGASGSAGLAEFISFAMGDDQYGVDIMAVREIKEWSKVTHLPKQPEYVRGVLNLRGTIVPIVDLRCRFGQGLTEPTPTPHRHHRADRRAAGRPDRRPRARHRFGRRFKEIQKVPRTAQGNTTNFLAGLVTHDNVMIALIDLPNLLSMPFRRRLPAVNRRLS